MPDAARPIDLVRAAASALKDRREEIDRLNVFPVPDGDTGTNMSLTMDAVMAELERLPADAGLAAACHAITHGSLMGARGNSGVILSQILRGLCDTLAPATEINGGLLRDALRNSVTIAFQAVRKPVEGTILTVLRDAAAAAGPAAEADGDISQMLDVVVEAAYESVRRTPDLLPVLKENGVVDAGGYGLAVLADGFASALRGTQIRAIEVTVPPAVPIEPEVGAPAHIVPINDWDDTEYLYCTEFLLFGDKIDVKELRERVSSFGGSELVVGGEGSYKVHVHTNDPAQVLAYATGIGEVAEVHINNMRRQTEARSETLRAEEQQRAALKPLGFVAVAAGEGLQRILGSLGVDKVVSGGQTMNPSTAELLEAVEAVPAQAVIILPNNRNIIMAAQQTIGLASKPVGVVPTTSVPEAFSAMLVADANGKLEGTVTEMAEAASHVRTAEVTTAIRDSIGKSGPIKAGQLIGVMDHEIEVVGSDLGEVSEQLLDKMARDGEVLTLLAGKDLSDDALAAVAGRLHSSHPGLEVETHRGEQPLYPLIMAVE